MTREKDYQKFITMLKSIAEAARYKPPSDEAIELLFKLTEHLSYEEIEKNTLEAFRQTGLFPTYNEMVDTKSDDTMIESDYELAQKMVDQFVFEGFGQTGSNIIAMKLKELGKKYLMPFINRNAGEMFYSDNPTASRAQLKKKLKVHYLEHKRLLIEAKEREKLGEGEKKQIDDQKNQVEGLIDDIVGKK